jgi:hypothetical protein
MNTLDDRIRAASQLTRDDYSSSSQLSVPKFATRARRRRIGAAASAAAVLLVVSAGSVALIKRDGAEPQASAAGQSLDPAVRSLLADYPELAAEIESLDTGPSTDVDEVLFLLPEPASGYAATNGSSSSAAEVAPAGDQPRRNEVLFAAVVNGGLERFVVLTLSSATFDTTDGGEHIELLTGPASVYRNPFLPTDGGERIELLTGPATVYRDPFLAVVQQRGTRWIMVSAGIRSEGQSKISVNELSTLVEGATIAADGRVTVDQVGTGLIELARSNNDYPFSTGRAFRAFEVGDGITVEQVTSARSSLLVTATSADRAEPAMVAGHQGWLVSRSGADGTMWRGLVWNEQPNQLVAVSGEASLADLRSVAESLRVVDRDEWVALFPDDLGLAQTSDSSIPPTTG